MLTHLRPALVLFVLLSAVTGLAYPYAVTGVAQAVFPAQANGSLVMRNGQVVGSSLIAQGFAKDEYFHARPSAAGEGYDAAASSGSNIGPTAAKLRENAAKAIAAENLEGPSVPSDLVTTSASGLDPHITPAAAAVQVPRIARARGVGEPEVASLLAVHTEGRLLGLIGEPRVNVLELNLALDARFLR
jgi:K+-transporting ATPase ATPase C chain